MEWFCECLQVGICGGLRKSVSNIFELDRDLAALERLA
jgi:hypothetical protein